MDERGGAEGRRRAVIEGVSPELDGGRHAVKRALGEPVVVEADIFCDGHDAVRGALLYRPEGEKEWREAPLEPLGDDRWRGSFTPDRLGRWRYTLRAWVDRWRTWRLEMPRRLEGGQDVGLDLEAGALLLDEAAARASGAARIELEALAKRLRSSEGTQRARAEEAADAAVEPLVARWLERRHATPYDRELAVVVDDERARFGAWYEMFPRSAASEPGRHGTFADVEARLPYVAALGFDVLYLPPIHPIGREHRKGRNGAVTAQAGDVGSPWAIGAREGGHDAVHPDLGGLEGFARLVAAARKHGIDLALDLALQCAPDHPYLREHPGWFKRRPDGTIRHAENPPKRYEDIVPFDFECEDWRALWDELRRVVLLWVERGVRIFRVDNPHTKSFGFWEWLIAEVKKERPDAIFLSEAFTRRKVMYRLAKIGFTQSYNYFPWRNGKDEIVRYLREVTSRELREFFRPNLWPSTPDILTETLQTGGRAAFALRFVLAATLGASYGIYGPAFELCEGRPRSPGSEEFLDSEKYEVRCWRLDEEGRGGLRDLISRVNRIRRESPALQSDARLRFHATDNERLLAYAKSSEDGRETVLCVVNLDPHHAQRGWVDITLDGLAAPERESLQAHDLLGGGRYQWTGGRNFVELDPRLAPAHIFRLRRRVRTERDFDYFL